MRRLINILRRDNVFILLSLIVIAGFYLRTFNIYWDSLYSFHPDERAIIMKIAEIKFPSSISDFLSRDSLLNPHFFAYGSFPLYLLKAVSGFASYFNNSLSLYPGLFLPGRIISAIFDTVTIILVYAIARKLFDTKTGLFSALVYSLSVLPIQLSHYFAVDTILTTFMSFTLFYSLSYVKNPKILNSLLLGVFFGFALATKISALIFGPIILLSFIIVFKTYKNRLEKNKQLVLAAIVCGISTIFVFFVTQPYAILDWSNYISQTTHQSKMSNDPFLFPYTLQFVGKIKYVYELKQVFFWGLGPVAATLSFAGLVVLFYNLLKNRKKNLLIVVFLTYSFFYFLIFGSFAVGWVRYMLPFYPLLAITGGYLITKLIPKAILKRKLAISFITLALAIYPMSYLSIYQKPNTRVQASKWIHENIPQGTTIAVEHWDDSLPVYNGSVYRHFTLPLYDEDLPIKWKYINDTLAHSDYIIIASNRLYAPLQKLTNCSSLPAGKCYPNSARYYKDLFSQKLGFKQVAQFTSYPTIPFLNLSIPDEKAAEDFTVFDHPKIMIFKKIDLVELTY